MSSFPNRASRALARLRFFVPALLLTAVAALIDHPAVSLLLLMAQPLFVAGAVSALGYLLESDFFTLAMRRGVVFLVLLACFALFVAAVVGTPTVHLARQASPLNAALLSGGIALSVLVLWRWWPAFGLAFLWDDAYPEVDGGSWIITAAGRSLTFARHLTREHDAFFGSGLIVALALLAVVMGAMSLAGLGGLLPSELRISALWLYALLICPVAAWLIAWRTERLLFDARAPEITGDADEAPDEYRELAAPAIPASNARDPAQRDAQLLAAAAAHQIDLALSLLAAGGDPNVMPDPRDRDQRSLAIVAATSPDMRLLRELIARGADLNRPVGGLTPLIAATRDSYQGRPDAVMTLLTNGADPRVADGEGNTALHFAALSREATVAAILLDAGADTSAINRDGLTALGMACAAGNEVLVRYLLEHRARTEVPRAVPALIAAAGGAEDHAALVKILIKHKAEIDARDRLGRTALHTAALHGHAEIAELLLHAGAELDARDLHGVTPLMEAARAGSNRVLQRLVFRKPNPDFTDQTGRTALIIACQSRQANDETVSLLLTLGADAGIVAKDGRRAIDCAVSAGRWTVVAQLDPQYPVPSSVLDPSDEDSEPGTPPPDRAMLLASAIRHGRLALAAELFDLHPPLAPAELERVFWAVTAHVDEARLGWLFARGLPVEARDEHGTTLLSRVLHQHPLPLAAARALIDAGAASAGSSLRDLLSADLDHADAASVEDLAMRLLERGADPFGVDARGRTALHLAIARRCTRVVATLLARGSDANRAEGRGRTALHELAALPESLSLPLAKLLLWAGADPERASADGQTPVGAALAAGRTDLTRWLSWNSGFRHPGRPLRALDLPMAAQQGDLAAVQRLIELGLPIDARDAQSCTALLRACGGGHLQLVEWLIDRGADTSVVAQTGATCLSAAVTARRDAVVNLLLARGVAIDQRLPGGSTPLMVAAALGSTTIVRTLLDRQADPRLIDDQGNGVLHAAAQFVFSSPDTDRCRQLLKLLLGAGVAVDSPNQTGQSPLLLLLGARAQAATPTAQRGLVELMQLLISQGADVARQDERGVGVLHACAMHGLIDAAQALLRAGADPRAQDRLGRTPHEVALMLGYADVAHELRRAGGGTSR